MITYHTVRAIQQNRFSRDLDESHGGEATRHSGHRSLRELMAALAGRLSALGFRGSDGRSHPASPAY